MAANGARTALQQLEAQAQPTWEGLVEPLERLTDRLSVTWGIVGHLMGVKNSEELRQAHQTVQPDVVQFSMRLGRARRSTRALKRSRQDRRGRRVTRRSSASSTRSSATPNWPGWACKARSASVLTIQQELARLSTAFSNHVLDATKICADPRHA